MYKEIFAGKKVSGEIATEVVFLLNCRDKIDSDSIIIEYYTIINSVQVSFKILRQLGTQ